ncbi:uncharacterized protein F4807DRAFT_467711 [Annulohypoxylon truncatum]|uniref:uncharacterized protein n=1 Tax=Annulohypoxylon truncatum TaxID=327061 RepID=UPI002008806C|nr:uncharacterized protein F4807DRAFT_467711 [Annulohypoxylon truncatum]KAI1209521.1 hypothetical protein F4807DRAFT_467711 [Annulohypoxylon truncatum]
MSIIGEPIAIIGTSCRFPGNSDTPLKLWDLLREPCDLLEPLLERFNGEGWHHSNGKYHGHCNVKQSYQLAGEGSIRRFDAQFFGVNAVEANTIDPQMRLLLETVYEGLEAAGQSIERLRGSNTAVYTGMMTNSYKAALDRDLDSMGTYQVSGTSRCMLSNRLSYFFDWHGPSMTIDTACSSSLIAVHQAVQQLRSGQSPVAIVAGSNLLLDPSDYVSMSKLEMLSPDSRSRMWDKDANGYARGEGVAAVVLKTLSSAEADGDHIECIIRETATNQDGKTSGITMPSARAQTQLIRDCYARAGLDPADPLQRPQYFEAHGTGTPAGDPIEAEAIKTAFFPNDGVVQGSPDPLFVGGIKTIIGHSESVAGLAGLIKTSLALQYSTVPPNLLFSVINPKVEPFYGNLRIPTSAIPWPDVHDGSPRRASVNSFGFGGANAHAILESYMPNKPSVCTENACFIPFVFSAASEASLSLNMVSMRDYLQANGTNVNLRDLAMTLHSRRSRLPFGSFVAASTVQELSQEIDQLCQEKGDNTKQPHSIQHSPRVLSIFTGQGAQSVRMGAALIEQSESCQRIIDNLETRLAQLPRADRPSWSLKQELLRDSNEKISQAALSQPLCTALQILQVDLLREAEIGAAYSAGMISAEDAICIAYYRGLLSDLAIGPKGQRGAMLAIGTSFEDANEICSEEEFQGRVSVAAVNSSASIKLILEDEAYHSSHMVPCSSLYLRALRGLGIQSHKPTTPWFSSVNEGKLMVAEEATGLTATYWNDNMTRPVISLGPFDLVVEIGPHPALRGPALQIIQELGQNAVKSFANALGFIWTHLGTVDLPSYDKYITGCNGYNLKEYWHESRYMKAIRARPEPSTDQDMRWRNILCPKELPWLKDHALQQQAVFPAAGYVVAAIEAAAAMARARGLSVSLIEILHLDIGNALAFDSDDSRIETINSLTDIRQHGKKIEAHFKFNAAPTFRGTVPALLARCHVRVTLGHKDEAVLPARGPPEFGLSKVDTEDFYRSLSRLEYQYTGPFHALSQLQRKYGFATGYITNEQSQLLIHPAVLDAAFQSVLLAHCAPNSGGIWSLHAPKTIRAIRVDTLLCAAHMAKNIPVAFDCVKPAGVSTLEGDVDLVADIDGSQHIMVQVEALNCVPFSQPSAKEDKEMFSMTVWDVANPDAQRIAYDGEPSKEEVELALLLERMAVFYLRRLDREVPKEHPARSAGPYQHYFSFATHIVSRAKEGKLSHWSSQWDHDSPNNLATAYGPYINNVEVKLLKAIGDNIIDIATGRTLAIELGMEDDMLSQIYQQGLAFEKHAKFLGRLVKQISHRYPRMNILEVGAGTGTAAKEIFLEIGQKFASYTYTDISSGFFESAQRRFASQQYKMVYKVLDISKDARQQGYKEHSYDLIVAFAVLHATPKLQDTLRNIRQLLKPGGFLVVHELQPDNIARGGALFGAFPGWWLGADEGHWDKLLRATGFSVTPVSVFVSQAVDSRVGFLRDPLSAPIPLFKDKSSATTQDLILLGGSSSLVSKTIIQLKSKLDHQWGHNIKIAQSLADITSLAITSNTTILSLNTSDWEALKLLLQEAGTILWVSSGRRAENPFANIMIPTLDIQSFDIEGSQSLDAPTTMWQRQESQGSLLVTIEPELILEQNGTLVIPRVVPSHEMNNRYNSSRRSIFTPMSSYEKNKNIGIMNSDWQNICLHEVPEPEGGDGSIAQVTHSLCSAIRASKFGFMHVILGYNCSSGDQVVALTSQHTLKVPLGLSIPVEVTAGKEATFLTFLAYHLLASQFFEGLPKGAAAIIHEPSETFAAVLADEAEHHSIHITFTTTVTAPKSGWLTIHPMIPERAMRALIPTNTIALLDMSSESDTASIGSRLRAQLPSHCRYYSFDTAFMASSTWQPQGSQVPGIHSRLKGCVSRTLSRLASLPVPTSIVTLDKLTVLNRQHPDVVIDWSNPASDLTILVHPADSQVQFSNCRTYWLAGLSGSLGLLLCEWMIRHGAKYVVISSRNPNIDEAWLEKMHASGATVKVFCCDVTDKFAVSKLYRNLQSTLPPVAGVCQGAMVLEDILIRDMSLDALLKVTRPKVEGSLHLDQLFQSQDSDLDFFIFFSSVGSVAGRAGQSNYAAANLFMTAVAEQRRRRGQAASVMHIGPIFGAGYITQQGLDSSSMFAPTLKTMFPISEQDFCQHFAEAFIAGRSKYQTGALEVTTGLAKFKSVHEAGPFLSHFTQDRTEIATDLSTSKSKMSLMSQLAIAKGRIEVTRIVWEALIIKLSVLFQIELSKLEQSDPKQLRLDEMGIDSLMAVEIRGWFFKTFQANIPVLKILSGGVVADLIDTAAETIPRQLVPGIGDEGPGPQNEQGQSLPTEVKQSLQHLHEADDWPSQPNISTQHKPADKLVLEKGLLSSKDGKELIPRSDFTEQATSTVAEHQQQLELAGEDPVELSKYDEDDDSNNTHSHIQSPNTTPSDDVVETGELLRRTGTHITTSQCPEHEKVQVDGPSISLDERYFKLSFSQSLFWFSAAFSDDPTNLNLTGTFRLTAEINIENLKCAFIALGKQHESLRTRFIVKDGQPMQGIMNSTALSLEHYSIQRESELDKYTSMIHNHVYDLERGKTMRLAVISMSSNQHFFIIGMHHLAMDGQSFFPLIQDMLQHYTHSYQGMIARQYTEFSEKQHAEHASGGFKNELAFWKTELAEMPPPLPMLRMSTFTSRPLLQAYGNKHVDVRIGPDTKGLIQALCRRCRATPFHFHLAIFRVLLHRYTGSGNFSIGIGDANRTEEDLMGTIGDFVNLLPLVFRTESSLQFDIMLQETRSKALAALANSRVPFQLLLNELGVERSAVTTPIFQTFMDYRLTGGEKMSWGDFQFELLSFQRSKMAYDVAVDILDNADGDCLLTFIVRDDIYTQEDVEQLAGSYVFLAEAFASKPSTTLGDTDMFDDAKINEALNLGRGSIYQSRQWGSTVIHRIDEIAKRHPKRTTVVSGDGNVTSYDDVVHRNVDAIVADLEAIGITTGSRVAVLQEATPNWVSSILAVMRIGATYLPLDLGTPWARLAAIVADCRPEAVLVDEHTRENAHKLGFNDMKAIEVGRTSHRREGYRTPIYATPENDSMILYTSGSSGTPKGIVLTHQGIQSWLEPCKFLSQGFDMSLMQICTALCFGGSVCLLPRKLRGDARAISAIITRHKYLSWLKYGNSEALRKSSWKTALVGGEPLAASDDLRFNHMYGTTESTFCAANSFQFQPNYPAGIALPNYNVYILDEHRRPLPPGMQGEIYIGGAGVAREYLNNPSLTRQTFVHDPFATACDRDRGRWSRVDHGAILIEGRISGDTMVKLRGLRVDLREVEVAILRAGAGLLSEAIVSIRRSSSESPEFLVAHVVFEQKFSPWKGLELPLYMRPAFIVALDALPTTASGKLDRQAVNLLPISKVNTDVSDVIWTRTEERLKAIWDDILSHDSTNALEITPETDFFHIGGTSLSLLGLRDKIRTQFEIELPLVDLFEASVLSNMAHRIEGHINTLDAIDWNEETNQRDPLPRSAQRFLPNRLEKSRQGHSLRGRPKPS